MHGAKYFSSIDLAQGYYQVAIDERDSHKTAFRVGTGGLYEYKRMPMGLCNSLATFQRLMEACLAEANFDLLLIYLDDILVFSASIEEHFSTIRICFQSTPRTWTENEVQQMPFLQGGSEVFRSRCL